MTTARKLLTADDLLAMPDDGNRYELARGELLIMPRPGIMHTVVTGQLGGHIWHFIQENNLDFISGPEAAAYIEQNPDTVRAADYAIIPYRRGVEPLPDQGYIPGLVPDLVVEVISPGYRSAAGIAERVRMWRDAGVRLVVVAHIAIRKIVTHDTAGTVRRFATGGTLTLEPVLPGFACSVRDIFAV